MSSAATSSSQFLLPSPEVIRAAIALTNERARLLRRLLRLSLKLVPLFANTHNPSALGQEGRGDGR